MTKRSSYSTGLALIILMTLYLGGCASINLDQHMAENPEQALALARDESDPAVGQHYLLRMASRFQDQGQHQDARTLLQDPFFATASDELERQRYLLALAGAVELQDGAWARKLTDGVASEHFLAYPAELLARAALLQADARQLAGDPLSGAMTLILLGQTDNSTPPREIHDRIWQMLKPVNQTRLQAAADDAIGFETQGWLELALRLRAQDVDLDDQGRLIRQWQNNWPGHPAAQILPTDLALVAELAASRPEKLVLALPLNGNLASAGKAIRDGFLSAYYQDDSTDRSTTDIQVIDTTERPFIELYRDLAESNHDLIVGPLNKDALTQLSQLQTLPVPVLGLNYLPANAKKPDGLYQFGLSAEDEARQIADRLDTDDLRQLLVLIPFGEWGDRVEQALKNRMQELGLLALNVQRFMPEDNLRAVTADLLGITASRDRAIQVERTIGMNVEFEPRRRQDAEAVVLVATPTVARQFKPLFAFYYGGDLPVYSPSIVYEGVPNPGKDRDLNGILFTDIPWVLADDNPFRLEATRYLNGTSGQLGRLFAMGADAWQLSKRLPLLRKVEGTTIDGQTGKLTMDPDGSIHREQLWARFRNGKPRGLAPASAGENLRPQIQE